MNTTTIRTDEDARRYLCEVGALEYLTLAGDIVITEHVCTRCGGAGVAEQWRHTGWNCYQCGGPEHARWTERTPIKAYAQAERRKRTARAKREAKWAAGAEARKAAQEAREANRLETQRAWCEANGHGRITFAELDAKRAAEREAAKLAAQHVGTVGERITVDVKVVFRTSFDSAYGTVFLYVMVDAAGNKIVHKGSCIAPSEANDYRSVQKGDRFTLKATVKEHGSREGEKQTIVNRPKCLAILERAPAK
jgi:hypothetical protein